MLQLYRRLNMTLIIDDEWVGPKRLLLGVFSARRALCSEFSEMRPPEFWRLGWAALGIGKT